MHIKYRVNSSNITKNAVYTYHNFLGLFGDIYILNLYCFITHYNFNTVYYFQKSKILHSMWVLLHVSACILLNIANEYSYIYLSLHLKIFNQ